MYNFTFINKNSTISHSRDTLKFSMVRMRMLFYYIGGVQVNSFHCLPMGGAARRAQSYYFHLPVDGAAECSAWRGQILVGVYVFQHYAIVPRPELTWWLFFNLEFVISFHVFT